MQHYTLLLYLPSLFCFDGVSNRVLVLSEHNAVPDIWAMCVIILIISKSYNSYYFSHEPLCLRARSQNVNELTSFREAGEVASISASLDQQLSSSGLLLFVTTCTS